MDARHKWVFQRLSELFHVEPQAIEDYANQEGLNLPITKFFQDPKQKKMLFFCNGEPPNVSFSAQIGEEDQEGVPSQVSQGICAYIIRLGTKQIQTSNFEFDMIAGCFQSNYLNAFVTILKGVMIPALESQEIWGEVFSISSCDIFFTISPS
ncbi:hypothetical protein BLNAU_22920 [Blattamonas nauphoetae]|uniref:Uncharacterized protein n=1 Tax=Blattamonas nauphoetae TaxID=2049346 RepID=A0ABQ9WS52_9EUKA|nr:hypothetical protein BLNAU_22920 [Blattamonas nauphoetae]